MSFNNVEVYKYLSLEGKCFCQKNSIPEKTAGWKLQIESRCKYFQYHSFRVGFPLMEKELWQMQQIFRVPEFFVSSFRNALLSVASNIRSPLWSTDAVWENSHSTTQTVERTSLKAALDKNM